MRKAHRLNHPTTSEYRLFVEDGGKIRVRHLEYYTGPEVTPEQTMTKAQARRLWIALRNQRWRRV